MSTGINRNMAPLDLMACRSSVRAKGLRLHTTDPKHAR
jgi:hypothetical protein